MAYTKPVIIAQNSAAGSYAAGCPANRNHGQGGTSAECKNCERTY